MIRQPMLRLGRMLLAGALALWLVAPAAADEVVARVNGNEITERDVELATRELQPSLQNVAPDQHRQYVIAYLTDLELVARAAEQAGMADDAEYAERMAYLANRTLMEIYLERQGADAANEEAARELYASVVGQVEPEIEVRARHILVEAEEEATDLRARLDAGEDFAELAEAHSIDPGSTARGGDLGYMQQQALVPEFGDVAFALEPGDTSDPVESRFGWHIIHVEDRRESEPPSFEEVEDELMTLLSRQAQRDLIIGLRESAEIELSGEPDPELPEPGATPEPAE